ncbi:hypothetical protein ES703_92339 [subsurface metagenome]
MFSWHNPGTAPAGSLFSSSVPPLETTVPPRPHSPPSEPPEPFGTLSANFRHSHWQSRRQKIYNALTVARFTWRRLDAFSQCGASWWIMQSTTNDHCFKAVPAHCHDRFCDPCSQTRAALIRTNLATHVTDHPHRLITLTVKSLHEPLRVLLDRLLSSFRRLRRAAVWRDRVLGGAAFIHLTHNPETRSWHPHLHVIAEGRYIAKADLRQAWLQASGDSYVLDIRLIRHTADVVRYVSKYATKAVPPQIVDHHELLLETVTALHGRKLAYTFGTWSRWKLLKKPDDPDWKPLCHLNDLLFGPDGDSIIGGKLIKLLKQALDRANPQTTIVTVGPDPPTKGA